MTGKARSEIGYFVHLYDYPCTSFEGKSALSMATVVNRLSPAWTVDLEKSCFWERESVVSSTCSLDRCHLTSWTEEPVPPQLPTSPGWPPHPPGLRSFFSSYIAALSSLRKTDFSTLPAPPRAGSAHGSLMKQDCKTWGFHLVTKTLKEGREKWRSRIITLAGKAQRHQSGCGNLNLEAGQGGSNNPGH